MTKHPETLHIMSYNVHQCVGRDRFKDPSRIAKIIAEVQPDLVGLQEVDSQFNSDHEHHYQMEYLAKATGFEAVSGPTISRHGGDYGNVLLSRWPVLETRRLDLTVHGREPRGALDVDIAVGDVKVRVIVTHFGLRGFERRAQVKRLLSFIANSHHSPIIVMGDINEWARYSRTSRALHGSLGKTPSPRTFPASFPMLALDRILVYPKHALQHLAVHRSPLTRIASDHLPLTAIIRL